MKQRAWRHSDWAMAVIFLIWLCWTAAVWQRVTWLVQFDTHVANFWHASPQWFQRIMVGYTQLGNPHAITLITLLIGATIWLRHDQRATLFFWGNTWILAGYGNYLVKQVIQRPRPTAWRLLEIGGYSYPSGHSTTTTVLIGSLLVLAFDYWHRQPKTNLLAVLGCAAILLMMISRVVVGVHYPSDTIGGLLLGSVLLYISTRLSGPYRHGPLKQPS
ncbi:MULTISPECIES: phosphatase PAP2 family protein [Lactiplantibacillus]|uniref:phosphatase PAP2 family protein n=1 Tax=Lactiplantibacillus TaxID=2767842 RepID=UPI001C2013C5|nr:MULTISPECIES: phosphatase PAP2 family protein [Lactiplantibacillus]MBU7447136.1 phosphatase PAP2 family protein [Lactiplantibacillus sp. 7.2.4]MBU7480744.1 phosphatase PAP2 family protein [Lactiplantibacillus pentosus]